MGCGADTAANELMESLTAGLDFTLPAIDLSGDEFSFPGDATSALYQEVTRLTNADLTEEVINGEGTFDALMNGFKAHLREEFDKGRITGDQYSKAYIELTTAAMSNAVQFLLGRETTFWQAVTGQMQAIVGRAQIEVEKAKIISARIEANTLQANYALTKIKLATEDKNYCIADFNLSQMLPMQLRMVTEQAEAQRAQTMDTRLDGVTLVAGNMGVQKDLQNEQITSYKRDAEIKAAKLFSDAWITQKTIDEGLLAPSGFQNSSLDEILSKVKQNLNLTDI